MRYPQHWWGWMLICVCVCAGISCWTLRWVSCSISWASRGGVRSPADPCLWLVRLWRRAMRRLTCSSSARPMESSSNSEVFYTRARDSQVGDDELKVTRYTQQYWAVTTGVCVCELVLEAFVLRVSLTFSLFLSLSSHMEKNCELNRWFTSIWMSVLYTTIQTFDYFPQEIILLLSKDALNW